MVDTPQNKSTHILKIEDVLWQQVVAWSGGKGVDCPWNHGKSQFRYWGRWDVGVIIIFNVKWRPRTNGKSKLGLLFWKGKKRRNLWTVLSVDQTKTAKTILDMKLKSCDNGMDTHYTKFLEGKKVTSFMNSLISPPKTHQWDRNIVMNFRSTAAHTLMHCLAVQNSFEQKKHWNGRMSSLGDLRAVSPIFRLSSCFSCR